MSTALLVAQVVAERAWASRRTIAGALLSGAFAGLIVAMMVVMIVAYGTVGR